MPRFAVLLGLILLVFSGACREGPQAPVPGWIADAADVLTGQQEAEFIDMLTGFEARTSVQLIGVTVADLEGRSIEAYTLDLANAWGVGQEGVNNGVVVLVAPNERLVRIEVGRGMRWHISDERTAEIIAMMTPFLQENDYYQALRTGFEQIIAANDDVAWDVAYYSLGDVRRAGDEALGRIVLVEAAITRLEEDVADVTDVDGVQAQLRLTDNIDPGVFVVDQTLVFHARVNATDPAVLYLLGWEDVDEL